MCKNKACFFVNMVKDIYGNDEEDIIIHYDKNMKCIFIELYRGNELLFSQLNKKSINNNNE